MHQFGQQLLLFTSLAFHGGVKQPTGVPDRSEVHDRLAYLVSVSSQSLIGPEGSKRRSERNIEPDVPPQGHVE